MENDQISNGGVNHVRWWINRKLLWSAIDQKISDDYRKAYKLEQNEKVSTKIVTKQYAVD